MGKTEWRRQLSPIPHFLIMAMLLAFVLPALPRPANAIPTDRDDQLEDIGRFTPRWFAELQDIELVGDRAYVFGVGGMTILDISNPAVPLLLGRYEPPNHPDERFYRGAVAGNLVCGGGREDLLTIMDISDPTAPVSVAVHGTSGSSYEGAAMRDAMIYTCRHGDGLEIIDVSVPSQPVSLSAVTDLTNAWDVALAGDTAYVADGISGLAVIDISDPTTPVHVRTVPTSGAAVDVVLGANTAAVSSGSAGVDIFDLSDPRRPVRVSTINTDGLAVGAAITGNLVHIAAWDAVETWDLSNPARPLYIGGEDTPVRAMGLDARDDLVVVADWSRVRFYRPGPSSRGDIQVSVQEMNLGYVPLGGVVDTTFTMNNTGGAPINVSTVQGFGGNFEITTPGPFLIPAGETALVQVRYSATTGGRSTFIRIDSDDTDERAIKFPISVTDSPKFVDLGSPAPAWSFTDREQNQHSLSGALGKVVVMAFFANW